VAPDDRQEGGGERGDDPAADPGRRGAGQLLPRAEGCRRVDAEERDLERREPALAKAGGAGTMDIGLTQLNVANARSCLNAGTYGTMGVGLGQAIAAAVAEPSRPVIHLSGDSAIGFSGMEMETLVRYNFPVKIVVLDNGGIGPGMPEIPENPMFDMKPNSLIYGARYDRMMEAFGGKGFFVENPKDIRGALDEAMNHRGPALVNVVISQGAARKPQAFRWHS
jgi:2-hydroxyacyl-CoA lyase 1